MAAPDRTAERRTTETGDGIRWIDPRPVSIHRATDLGSAQVLKHVNLFLLTDQFGDIHPDSRGLGLYLGDTRILSCEVLRVGGVRPVLLQGSMGGNFRGTIHLTNPSIDRNPDAKRHPGDALASRKIGITRERLLSGDALRERVRIVNHSEHGERFDIELVLAADAADIFEVRGYPRKGRGTCLPIAVESDRLTCRYDGLDGKRRYTHVAFSEIPAEVAPIEGESDPGGWIRLRWAIDLEPGGRSDLTWLTWSTERPTPSPDELESGAMLFPHEPGISPDEAAGAYQAWTRGSTAVATWSPRWRARRLPTRLGAGRTR